MAKILVVDDEAMLREVLRDYLVGLGHGVDTADSGMAALTKLRSGDYQLVTLDIDMPGLGGMETLKLIRKEPKFASLPVLMCTGRNALGTIDDALEDGATGYLIKPFDFTMLAKKVSAALSAKA